MFIEQNITPVNIIILILLIALVLLLYKNYQTKSSSYEYLDENESDKKFNISDIIQRINEKNSKMTGLPFGKITYNVNGVLIFDNNPPENSIKLKLSSPFAASLMNTASNQIIGSSYFSIVDNIIYSNKKYSLLTKKKGVQPVITLRQSDITDEIKEIKSKLGVDLMLADNNTSLFFTRIGSTISIDSQYNILIKDYQFCPTCPTCPTCQPEKLCPPCSAEKIYTTLYSAEETKKIFSEQNIDTDILNNKLLNMQQFISGSKWSYYNPASCGCILTVPFNNKVNLETEMWYFGINSLKLTLAKNESKNYLYLNCTYDENNKDIYTGTICFTQEIDNNGTTYYAYKRFNFSETLLTNIRNSKDSKDSIGYLKDKYPNFSGEFIQKLLDSQNNYMDIKMNITHFINEIIATLGNKFSINNTLEPCTLSFSLLQ